ncbi:MAG: L-serine ammonia-lyase [Myxococcaceae bacterium]|nr:L-serine ammonia-lyase [Myxococcaceae bacterium]
MHVSVFDIFKIGIGPSSSHTVGPMRAARRFVERLQQAALLPKVKRVTVELYGSLAFTGKGHGSDKAIVLGLRGELPESVDIDSVEVTMAEVEKTGQLTLWQGPTLSFQPKEDVLFRRAETLPLHSNGLRFTAQDAGGGAFFERVYYSVGGGFVVNQQGEAEFESAGPAKQLPHPFESGDELLARACATKKPISQLMLENELTSRSEADVREKVRRIAQTMEACIRRGCEREGVLPGGLKVKRRAASLHQKLLADPRGKEDPLVIIDWVNLYALAVNEENAAGGRVVTAPTNGAAGIIPAVLQYYRRFVKAADDEGTLRFLLTAAAIGALYQKNASISGAEVGCQGEVGVACSMAAGALAEVLGGTPAQVENAAEIGMEHNLGLTCDPVGGLVQVPCIERNAMGAVKAINAARLSLLGDGTHKVSLDKVIATMRQTGADMSSKYKETARGGLAVNIIEC